MARSSVEKGRIIRPAPVVRLTHGLLDEFPGGGARFIGVEIAQEAHAEEMAANGGPLEDSANGVGVGPRTRETLVFTFAEAGSLVAGCHLPGHFGAGMRTTIAIGP